MSSDLPQFAHLSRTLEAVEAPPNERNAAIQPSQRVEHHGRPPDALDQRSPPVDLNSCGDAPAGGHVRVAGPLLSVPVTPPVRLIRISVPAALRRFVHHPLASHGVITFSAACHGRHSFVTHKGRDWRRATTVGPCGQSVGTRARGRPPTRWPMDGELPPMRGQRIPADWHRRSDRRPPGS